MRKYYKGYYETGYVTWHQKSEIKNMQEIIDAIFEEQGIELTQIEEIPMFEYYYDSTLDKIKNGSLSAVWAYLAFWIACIVLIKPQFTLANVLIPLGIAFGLEQLESMNRKLGGFQ